MEPIALTIRQARRATFRALHGTTPGLIRVQSGLKRLRIGARVLEIPAGALAVLAPRQVMEVENRPAAGAPYKAALVVLPEPLVDAIRAETGPGEPMRASTRGVALAAFDRAAAWLGDPLVPARLRIHALREVLLWLAEEGIGFGPATLPGVTDRLRGLLSASPDRDWRAPEAARALGQSEPTLRRHLAGEGTSFTALLADVRMETALGLLQGSTLSVNRIALEVGYACPSRFALRFRKRFGLAPSDLRRGERIGMEVEPPGTAKGLERV